MIKQQIYKNILASRSGMGYSPGIQFQTILISMDKAKATTMKNQPGKSTDKKKRCRCGFLELLRITSKEFIVGLFYQNTKRGLGDWSFSTRGEEVSRRCISRSREICSMSEDSLINDESAEE